MKKVSETIKCPPILIKVGSKEKLEKMVNKGQIYFGSLSDYRGEEQADYLQKLAIAVSNSEQRFKNFDFFRLDPLESIESITYSNNLSEDFTLKYNEKHTHAFSVFGFAEKVDFDFKISEYMRQFGNYFILIKSRPFLEQLYPVLLNKNMSLNYLPEYGYVKYYDIVPGKNLSNLTQFHKKRHYGYQCEYRIIATLPPISISNKGSIINLGSKSDVFPEFENNVQVLPIDELFKMLVDIR